MWTIIVRLTWEVHCGDIAYFKLFKPTYVHKIHKHKDDDFLVFWSSFMLKVVYQEDERYDPQYFLFDKQQYCACDVMLTA